MRSKLLYAWAGFCAACSLISLHADAYGREAYAQHVSDSWVTEWFSVPAAIFGIAISFWVIWGYDWYLRRQLRVPESK